MGQQILHGWRPNDELAFLVSKIVKLIKPLVELVIQGQKFIVDECHHAGRHERLRARTDAEQGLTVNGMPGSGCDNSKLLRGDQFVAGPDGELCAHDRLPADSRLNHFDDLNSDSGGGPILSRGSIIGACGREADAKPECEKQDGPELSHDLTPVEESCCA